MVVPTHQLNTVEYAVFCAFVDKKGIFTIRSKCIFLEKSNNSKRTLISDLCCPEIVFAFKIFDLLLYWKSLYGKFGGLIVLLEYVSKQNMLIVSILMSKQHHFYCNMKVKQISQLTRKCRERRGDIGWKNLSGKLSGDEAKKWFFLTGKRLKTIYFT